MKNILLLLSLLSMTCTLAEAQKIALSGYMGTVILHASSQTKGVSFSQSPSAPELRIAASYKADAIELRSGLSVSRNEITGKVNIAADPDDYYNIRFTAVRVPLNVQYNVPLKYNPLTLFGGPYLGYTIYGQSRTYTKQGAVDVVGVSAQKFSWGKRPGQTNPLDFGVQLGAEYQFAQALAINLQYSQSFQNINIGSHIRFTYQSIHAGIALKLLQPKMAAARIKLLQL